MDEDDRRGDGAARQRQRDLVRRGYDVISRAYRRDDGQPDGSTAEDTSRYAGWVADLARLLPPRARVVDLGCGAGIPATRELNDHGLRVMGVDFSAVQLHRARELAGGVSLVQADMTAFQLAPASVDAVVSFYALIHVPLADQQTLFPRIRGWLRPGGYFLAIVGAHRWTGTEPYLGADMFWDHADTGTYLRWLEAARLAPVWHRFIPEGKSGHTLILARAARVQRFHVCAPEPLLRARGGRPNAAGRRFQTLPGSRPGHPPGSCRRAGASRGSG